ncbi:MAG: hypothetical protein JW909_01555 [Planctomycetes bacterium]|nr:hypothetical protein [Planctomycetota bacterium]
MSKRRIIAVVTLLGGVYYFLKFFLPPDYGGRALESQWANVSRFWRVMGSVMIGLGVINIFRVYGRKVVKKAREWPESIALLLAFMGTIAVGLVDVLKTVDVSTFTGVQAAQAAEPSAFTSIYWDVMFNGVLMSFGAAIFSLLGFYITQAAFRAFRVRSFEAALIMASAVFIMLGALPMPVLSDVLPEWLGGIRTWLLTGVNVGVQRAVLVGSLAAGLIMAVRMWFSLDRGGAMADGGGGLR